MFYVVCMLCEILLHSWWTRTILWKFSHKMDLSQIIKISFKNEQRQFRIPSYHTCVWNCDFHVQTAWNRWLFLIWFGNCSYILDNTVLLYYIQLLLSAFWCNGSWAKYYNIMLETSRKKAHEQLFTSKCEPILQNVIKRLKWNGMQVWYKDRIMLRNIKIIKNIEYLPCWGTPYMDYIHIVKPCKLVIQCYQ